MYSILWDNFNGICRRVLEKMTQIVPKIPYVIRYLYKSFLDNKSLARPSIINRVMYGKYKFMPTNMRIQVVVKTISFL